MPWKNGSFSDAYCFHLAPPPGRPRRCRPSAGRDSLFRFPVQRYLGPGFRRDDNSEAYFPECGELFIRTKRGPASTRCRPGAGRDPLIRRLGRGQVDPSFRRDDSKRPAPLLPEGGELLVEPGEVLLSSRQIRILRDQPHHDVAPGGEMRARLGRLSAVHRNGERRAVFRPIPRGSAEGASLFRPSR
jgi:hypothetical protein